MSYKEIINKLTPFDYSKYMNISSNEKLMIYAAYELNERKVPLTFNYICIAAFKLFPEKFCCDEEFKEFPSIDRLNRTYMHLKYVKNGKPYLTGSMKNGYSLTSFGIASALEVKSIITNSVIDKTVKVPVIDKHKKGFGKDYKEFVETPEYKKYLLTQQIDLMFIWKFFNVIPYTQIKSIKDDLNDIKEYAKTMHDSTCIEFITEVQKLL